MLKNPYKFQGPLDPIRDRLVCSPRKDDVNFIIEKISRQEYVAIQGPRQIGKTTLLFLVKNQFKHADYAYINFEVAPGKGGKEKAFYQWLIHQLLEKIPYKKKKFKTITGEYPDVSFIDFLKNFNPKREKIILLFDEIDRLDFLNGFLHVWRNIYHESFVNKIMQNYTLITTSSKDLLKIPSGPNSPFNIANTLNIKDLTEKESEEIIDNPFKKLKIKITPDAKQELLSQVSGHPQLLQHTCCLLVEKATKKEITETYVDEAIKQLSIDHSDIKKKDVRSSGESERIIDSYFKESKIKIKKNVKQRLLSQIPGNLELLQKVCQLLVKKAEKMEISKKDVADAISRLLKENSVLKTLDNDINESADLKNLIKNIVKKRKEKIFYPYKDFALMGAGAIKEENSKCKIRNQVFEKFIIDFLKNPVKDKKKSTKSTPSSDNQPKKWKKLVKFFIYTLSILAISMFALALLLKDILLMTGASILATITASLWIPLFTGGRDESQSTTKK